MTCSSMASICIQLAGSESVRHPCEPSSARYDDEAIMSAHDIDDAALHHSCVLLRASQPTVRSAATQAYLVFLCLEMSSIFERW